MSSDQEKAWLERALAWRFRFHPGARLLLSGGIIALGLLAGPYLGHNFAMGSFAVGVAGLFVASLERSLLEREKLLDQKFAELERRLEERPGHAPAD